MGWLVSFRDGRKIRITIRMRIRIEAASSKSSS